MLEAYILDAATIYARASAVFEYARFRAENFPADITWDHLRRALSNLGFWYEENPSIFATIDRRERATPKGPD